ncbi:odorant receptor 131-2-like [Pagrus major]|uniref:odorant receptor 131-2-like n=1 Tax=Pagrus major TaxID=143350 RepID=UPI003CC85A17
MSSATQSQINITVGRGLLERVMISTVFTVPCCVFLFINGTMLFTLRSKSVFRETSRYILLYNLLFADTVLLVHGQLMYILAASRATLTYPVCGVLIMLANLTTVISPLTLLVMSLERCVAVCYPLKHATIVTIRNTEVAIIVVWTFSALNIFTKVLLLLNFRFEELQSLQMKRFCGGDIMLLNQMSELYDKCFTYCLFLSTGVTVSCSYMGVILVARSACTDKASKARNTLLLHLVQLGLSLCSTVYSPMLIALSKVLDRTILLPLQIVFYVCLIIFPRCLSSLIYGVRDQTIRPVLLYNLCFQRKCSLCLSHPDKY